MHKCLAVSMVLGLGLVPMACAQPDLVVSSLTIPEPPTINAENQVVVPIHVVVQNVGKASAEVFKVAVSYTTPDERTVVVAFTVPGEPDYFYPYTDAPLAPGASTTFRGVLTFNSNVRGIEVDLVAMADSCSGDEFMPGYCRVNESNELNNDSLPVLVELP